MSLKGPTPSKPGTLIVEYVTREYVNSFIVPNGILTEKDLAILEEADQTELSSPDIIFTRPPSREHQHSMDMYTHLEERMNNAWKKYRVPSKLVEYNYVKIAGKLHELDHRNTEKDTNGKDSTLEVTRMFSFTVEY